MRRWTAPLLAILILAILSVGLLAACAGQPAAPRVEPAPAVDAYTGGPRLAFDYRSVDFGDVPFNQEVRATFEAKNVGDQPLRLGKVSIKTIEGC